jgi:hypothetical protein
VQAAHRLDELLAGTEVEVVRVSEEDRRAELAQALGSSPFTVPLVPTGMKAGVGTSPWAVWRTPARASPSDAPRSKLIRSTFSILSHCASTGESWLATLEAGGGTGWPLTNQHRIAERVEAIPLLDRDLVEPPRLLHPGERHHNARSDERGRWKFVTSESTRGTRTRV